MRVRHSLFALAWMLSAALRLPPSLPPPVFGSALGRPPPATTRVVADLSLYGPITAESCRQLTQALLQADRQARDVEEAHIALRIQSGGGEVIPALFVCDVIRALKTPVHTYVEGVSASAASLISVCGAHRLISPRGTMMLHQLSGSVEGTHQQMVDRFTLLHANSEQLHRVYAEHTEMSPGDVRRLLARDLWLNASECVRYGLVDGIGVLLAAPAPAPPPNALAPLLFHIRQPDDPNTNSTGFTGFRSANDA